MITVTYIWHDCFVIDTPDALIVFDFWKDPEVKEGSLPLFLASIPSDRKIYVVVSHHHKDHYTKDIFGWTSLFPDIHFILSKDVARYARHILNPDSIYKGVRPLPQQVTVLAPGEKWNDSLLEVSAFGSTDIGNSYKVRISGLTLFHAGDLNAWLWKDESTEAEIKEALDSYISILDDIACEGRDFDIAMFPVDSRIGRDYYEGAAIFIERMNVRRFFPMHFGLGDESEQRHYRMDAARFPLYANKRRGEYIALQAPYSLYAFPGN